MIDAVSIGASVSMTPAEVHALSGNGPVRLVTCPNGRIIAGTGAVGFVELVDGADLQVLMDEVKEKRAALATLALEAVPENPRANLYTFTRI